MAALDGDPSEWVDVVILGLDGLMRSLVFGQNRSPAEAAQYACALIQRKQSVNEGREWPDWRGASPDKAIEHVRR